MFTFRNILLLSTFFLLTACGSGNNDDAPDPRQEAVNRIAAYAQNGISAPTLQDYVAAGITGVTAANLAAMNFTVSNLIHADVDSSAEIQALTNQLNVNVAPIANAGSDLTVPANQTITLTGSGTDTDGTIVSYQWEKDGTTLASTANFNYTPNAEGTDTLTLVVTDNNGVTTSDTVNVTVTIAWAQGVFTDESNFKNRCESPRTGVDIDGDAYPDQAGSKLHEKHWLRSWSNNTYLWYDEIFDRNPAAINEPEDYFDLLKTTAVTDSGNARDRFHFYQDTAEFEQLASGGAAVSYGARFKLLTYGIPREVRIAYIEPNSPAEAANLARGTEVLTVDGVDITNGSDVDTIIAGLYPESDGESHTLVVRDLGETTTRTVVLQAEVVVIEPVKKTNIINTTSGKVGYLAFNTFGTQSSEAALVTAFNQLLAEEPDDLVLDLRYNGGGYLAISAQLGYMIANSSLSDGSVFEKTVFNDKHPSIDPVTGQQLTPLPFLSETIGLSAPEGQDLPSLNLDRVFILSSGDTCSASEALINALRGIDVEVVLIGDTTCGKPYGFYPTDNCGTTYFTVQFRGENAKDFGDYADGFSPMNAIGTDIGERIQGCQVTEDILHPLGDQQEVMLKAALDYRETMTCPPVMAARSVITDAQGDLKNNPRMIKRKLLEQVRMDSLRFIKQ